MSEGLKPFNTSPAVSLPKHRLPRAARRPNRGWGCTRTQQHLLFPADLSSPLPQPQSSIIFPQAISYLSISDSPPHPQITYSRAEQSFPRFPTQISPGGVLTPCSYPHGLILKLHVALRQGLDQRRTPKCTKVGDALQDALARPGLMQRVLDLQVRATKATITAASRVSLHPPVPQFPLP